MEILSHDSPDPATPDLFHGSYATDDTSSVEGVAASGSARRKRRGRPPLYLTGEPIDSWTDHLTSLEYKVGDFVFFEGSKGGECSRIGTILAIRLTKKQKTIANIRLYFKSSELPEGVYQRLMEERNGENLAGFGSFLLANPLIKEREVFKSEKTEVVRTSSVRGKCSVIQLTDVHSVRKFVASPDTFFTLLGYNPDTRRLATIQGEIRIGSGHQAKLPECKQSILPSARPCRSMPEGIGGGDNGEEQLWSPDNIPMDELEAYVTATRSMVASFTNMSERKAVDESVASARRDENTQLALNHLHRSDYDKNRAVAEFVKSVPLVRSVDRRWDDEDSKKFMKGLRVFGKNFFRIRKEFLPEKETKELIEYYYYWKKTPISTVPNRHGRRPKSRKSGGSTSKAASSAGENSSESEEMESTESYSCFRCDTESSNQWHYVDQHGFVCESCKLNYRKFGDENGDRIPEYLFRPVEPASTCRRPLPKRKLKEEVMDTEAELPTETDGMADETGRKSPSASSTCSNGSTSKTPRKRKAPGNVKRTLLSGNASSGLIAPKQEALPSELQSEATADPGGETPVTEGQEVKKADNSSPDSLASELERRQVQGPSADGEDAGNMGDVEQDDNSTEDSPPSPTPSSVSEHSLQNEEPVLPDTSTAVPCNEVFHKTKNAHFVRCLQRENNSCCRIDVHYLPPPLSDVAKKRQESAKKPLASVASVPQSSTSQVMDMKVKLEPHSGSSDVIRHTSQTMPPMRATVPPSSMSMQSPHHHSRDQRLTSLAPSSMHSAMSHAASHPANHRVTTPSQRVTPRSQQSSLNEQMFHPNTPSTPALLHLSQLAGRQSLPQQSINEEMAARLAAYSANPMSAMAAAMSGLPPGMESIMSLQYYRMARNMFPVEQIERIYPPEIRERLDAALKAQDMESHQKMLLAGHSAAAAAAAAASVGGHAGGMPMESKSLIEAQMMEMQRKLQQSMPPGGMLPPGALAGLPMGMPMGLPPSSMAGSNITAEMFAREREKLQKLGGGLLGSSSVLSDPMSQMSQNPAERMSSADRLSAEQRLAAGLANTAHAHTHTHTHLHLHQQAEQAAQQAQAQAQAAAALASQHPFLAQQFIQNLGDQQAALARAAAASGGIPYGALPPGFPGNPPMGLNIPTSTSGEAAQFMAALAAAQGQEVSQREQLLAMQQQLMSANPAAVAAHQEALQRHLLQQERERQLSHLPPH